jgi:hypothetical protein
MNTKTVKQDSLDSMWSFLQMGGQEAGAETVEHLQEQIDWLIKAMTQKTGGQRKHKSSDVDWTELEMRENFIIIDAMALYLSGGLEKLKKTLEAEYEKCEM